MSKSGKAPPSKSPSITYEVLSIEPTYKTKKIVLALKYGGLVFSENYSKSVEELDSLLESKTGAKSVVLKVMDSDTQFCKYITRSNVILRYIGSQVLGKNLYGMDLNLFSKGKVDEMLDYIQNDLEIPLNVLALSKKKKASGDSLFSKKTIETAKTQVEHSLGYIEHLLSTSTYLTAERVNIADFALYTAIFDYTLEYKSKVTSTFPSFFRWFNTVENHTVVKDIESNNQHYREMKKLLVDSLSTSNRITYTVTESIHPAISNFKRGHERIVELQAKPLSATVNTAVTVKGWVRTIREANKGDLLFVELTDGSNALPLQCILENKKTEGFEEAKPSACGGAGASMAIRGIVVESPGKGQSIEIQGSEVQVIGKVYAGTQAGYDLEKLPEVGNKYYPLSKKQHSMEFLREKAHLRPRTRIISTVARIRHAMAFATHKFFDMKGFKYIHTPLITGADCEGAGEQFCVTSLLPEDGDLSAVPTVKETGKVDYTKDFFSKRTSLTVSGQLNVETFACALNDVYTFGPTFRAENSHTTRHLAEFWMIEPEICFAALKEDIDLAEDYLKYCVDYALTHNKNDLEFLSNMPQGEKGLVERLINVLENPFVRITYTDAIALLVQHVQDGIVTFETEPSWGIDMGSEHERYLTEKVFQKPVVVTNYPKDIKAFYMKLDPDGRTVSAMDILVPKIGEIIGGSQREDDLMVLIRRAKEMNLDPNHLWWYLDLRKYGSVPHAGFGLGFERLILFITGMENIRDVIPFPRYPGNAEF